LNRICTISAPGVFDILALYKPADYYYYYYKRYAKLKIHGIVLKPMHHQIEYTQITNYYNIWQNHANMFAEIITKIRTGILCL